MGEGWYTMLWGCAPFSKRISVHATLPTVQALNRGVTPSIVKALTCKHIFLAPSFWPGLTWQIWTALKLLKGTVSPQWHSPRWINVLRLLLRRWALWHRPHGLRHRPREGVSHGLLSEHLHCGPAQKQKQKRSPGEVWYMLKWIRSNIRVHFSMSNSFCIQAFRSP